MNDGVAELLAGVIRAGAHPDVTAVEVEPSGAGGWCRVRFRFADGSAAYVGVNR